MKHLATTLCFGKWIVGLLGLCKGDKYSEPIRQLEINTEHDHRKRPKHGEVSLSEIDNVCGPINVHESKRDQGINTADTEAVKRSWRVMPIGSGSAASHSLCKFLTR